MNRTVEFVGGPLCGQRYPYTAARFVEIPDACEIVNYVRDDGTVGTLFGRQRYEMVCYRKGDRCKHQLEYRGYASPRGPQEA